jgi:uncharacterized protein (UPF0261 family)
MKPAIICAGILDTKGREIRFMAEKVRTHGGSAIILDLSLGNSLDWADISVGEVLSESGIESETVFRSTRAEAARIVSESAARKVLELYRAGEVDGIIAWGGAMGTSVATSSMRALPIGAPKIMLSTVASSDVSGWLVHSDIFITNPIAEQGINAVTRMIVDSAAAAVVAMARTHKKKEASEKPLAALTAYGTTYSAVQRCARFMEKRGWETISLHATGNGATMEDLIRQGRIQALYDITTAELSNTRFNSPYGIKEGWKGERLTAAADTGIPQVICPGGIDQFTLGPLGTVPGRYMEEYKRGVRISHTRERLPYVHNPNVTTLTPTIEETREISRCMIEKLNRTTGPTVLFIPMRGWSSYDQPRELASVERGWPAEQGHGPVWWPNPDMPSWSHRAVAMRSVVREYINRGNRNLDAIPCDMHLLDEVFSDLLNRCMGDMLDGRWKRGKYREVRQVMEL